jgi:hypothetical protein
LIVAPRVAALSFAIDAVCGCCNLIRPTRGSTATIYSDAARLIHRCILKSGSEKPVSLYC